jgi:hypothetical protein
LPFLKIRIIRLDMAKPESKSLRSTAGVIRALGTRRVCAMTRKDHKRVSEWRGDDTFPARYFLVMWCELAARGYRVSPRLWGQAELPRGRKTALAAFAQQLQAA